METSTCILISCLEQCAACAQVAVELVRPVTLSHSGQGLSALPHFPLVQHVLGSAALLPAVELAGFLEARGRPALTAREGFAEFRVSRWDRRQELVDMARQCIV